jgi:hypothetical protein
VTCAVRESNQGCLIQSPTIYLLSQPDSYNDSSMLPKLYFHCWSCLCS